MVNVYDTMLQELNCQMTKSSAFIKEIDKLEQLSIDQVERSTCQAEKDCFRSINDKNEQIRQTIEIITRELDRKWEDYSKSDRNRLIEQLNKFQQELIVVPDIAIDNARSPLINLPQLSYLNEKFGQANEYMQIEQNGQIAMSKISENFGTAEVRGARLYFCGIHKIRLKIEAMENCMLIGIASSSSTSTLEDPCGYCWMGDKERFLVFIGGVCNVKHGGWNGDIRQGDIIELVLNCEDSKIQLINTRKKQTFELAIGTEHHRPCLRPWQLYLALDTVGDHRVKILA